MPRGTKATSSSDDDDTNADTHADTLASDSSDSLSDGVDEAFIRKLAKKFSKKKQNLKEKKKAPQTALQLKSRSSKTVRAKWTDEMESALVDAVHSTPDRGTDNNLKTQSWNEILRNLQASDHPDLAEKFDDPAIDSEALRNKWNALVADYKALKPFRGSEGGSGWSWCEKTHMLIQNDKGIWAEVIEKKLLKPKFQKQGFPHYDKIAEVVDGKYATGNAALSLVKVEQLSKQQRNPACAPSEAKSVSTPITPRRSLADDYSNNQHTPMPVSSTPKQLMPSTPQQLSSSKKRIRDDSDSNFKALLAVISDYTNCLKAETTSTASTPTVAASNDPVETAYRIVNEEECGRVVQLAMQAFGKDKSLASAYIKTEVADKRRRLLYNYLGYDRHPSFEQENFHQAEPAYENHFCEAERASEDTNTSRLEDGIPRSDQL
ncbi:hypothetical protein DFJ73DRAFT_491406 [Zopfochytrium polystomum]|nr:hypothetical protein DFJ73DRAFT_491406 [Zopfochytrium polystomum]